MIHPWPDSWGIGLPSPIITVFDLEYTAWECSMARHWLTPGEYREVVQIGAVKLDANSFARLDEFKLLVRPRVNHQLSAYFQKLTGISQEAVMRDGIDFADAYRLFLDFAGDGPIAAFGRDDRALTDNLRLYGITDAAPLPVFYDLRGWFAVQGLDPRGMLSCDIAPALGVPFVGQAHNALDDARSLAAGMAAMAARAKIRPAA
jgi:inhibitor of KinA sporulation pathway (predicted exonuclease)